MVSGFISLIAKLGIKGLIENFVNEYFEPLISNLFKLPDKDFSGSGQNSSGNAESSTKPGSSTEGEKKESSGISWEDYQWSSNDDYNPYSSEEDKEQPVDEINKAASSNVDDFKKSLEEDNDKDHVKNLARKIEEVIDLYKRDNVPAAEKEIPKLEEKLQACNDRLIDLDSKGKGKAK